MQADDSIDVYDGQRRLGELVPRRDGQVEARLASGTSLGWFNDQAAAARAIREASR